MIIQHTGASSQENTDSHREVDQRIPGSFDDFYRREFPRMVRLAYGRSGSRLAAEDLAQEAMVAAHRQWDVVGLLDRPGAWARRTVLNRSASWFHRRGAKLRAIARLAPVQGTPPARLDAETEHVWQEVRRLPPRQAEAIALFYLDDMAVAEVALVMSCSENTVKAHLHQARQKLAATLDHERDAE